MKGFIKKRVGKMAKRLFLHDRELNKTVFQVGSHFRYLVDMKSRKLFILPSRNEKDNTVSRRGLSGDKFNPLIDIRNTQSLSVFKGCDYLQITIYGDKVVVEGFVESKQSALQSLSRTVRNKIFGKIVDIRELISVRKKAEVVMSLKDLEQVVGLEQGFTEGISYNAFSSHDRPGRVIPFPLKKVDVPLKVMSLFSGAGLLDLGFIQEGFEIVYSLDINPYAVETYRRNLGNHIRQGDVKDLKGMDIPSVPIVIGGSPCMGFSNSNRRTNYLDNPHNLLVKEFIRVVKTNPATQIFVLENVGQLLTTGNGVYKREVYDVLSDFEITSGIVSAADMGAPQLRKRAILIGSKIGKIPLPGKAVNAFRTVREAFSGLTESVPNQLDFTKSKPETVERMKQVPEGGNFSNLVEERAKNHHSNYMRRLAWDRPSVTIVNFRKSPILHPSENRTLSVRECARLFGVPDDFVFYGPLAEKQQQVANGVPVPMAAAIARVIKERIIAYQREKGLVFA